MNLELFLVLLLPFLTIDAFLSPKVPKLYTHAKRFSSPEETIDTPESNYPNLVVGKTIDALNSNYPNLLNYLDTSIYNPRVSFTNLRGVKFCNNLESYSMLYESVRNGVRMFFQDTSLIDHHISRDLDASKITVTFKITLVPKLSRSLASDPASSRNGHVVVAGVSEYYLDLNGKIIKHILDEIKFDTPFNLVPLGMPDLIKSPRTSESIAVLASATTEQDYLDHVEARKKFGLEPISRDEYDDMMTRSMQYTRPTRPTLMIRLRNALHTLFRGMRPEECETFYDCYGMECCDYIVAKYCCHSGLGSPAFAPELVPIPIKVENQDYLAIVKTNVE